ncbi:type III effector protein [Streptomyces sp. NPDC021224]|uniref:type III effector protein n=1 Tax=unclassified Streptomyces TaxID=2593676 RepID=UPI00379B1258
MAAAAALSAIEDAVHDAVHGAQDPAEHPRGEPPTAAHQAMAALLLLRELRTQLAGWEAGIVEAARAAGATWADLAPPMGVASRQAAENRYLRLRPSAPGTTQTGAERVKAVRDRRAADRTVIDWARTNAADLRTLAARITALTDLPAAADPALQALHTALGATDAADLIAPLAGIRSHLGTGHPDLATSLDTLTTHTDNLRRASKHRRS